jgi:hypothetical protein
MGFDTEPTGYAKTLLSDLRGADPHCHREDGVGGRIVIVTDNDEGGHKLAEQIKALVGETGRGDLCPVCDLPARDGEDWNDVLRASSPAAPEFRHR